MPAALACWLVGLSWSSDAQLAAPQWLDVYNSCLSSIVHTNPNVDRRLQHNFYPTGYFFFQGTYMGNAGTWVVQQNGLPRFVEGGFGSTPIAPPKSQRNAKQGYFFEEEDGTRVYLALYPAPEGSRAPYALDASTAEASDVRYVRSEITAPIADDSVRVDYADFLAGSLRNLSDRYEEPNTLPTYQALSECNSNIRSLPEWAQSERLNETLSEGLRHFSVPMEQEVRSPVQDAQAI